MASKKSDDDVPKTAAAGSAGTVARTVRLLTAVADADGSISVSELGERLGLAVSTVHRLLQLLRAEGFISADPRGHQYAVGPEFNRIAARIVSAMDPTSVAQPYIESLAARFDETVLFGLYLPTQCAVAFTGRADGTQALQYRIDMYQPLSLVWGASGKAILAYLSSAEIRAAVAASGPVPAGRGSMPPLDALEDELARIRETGYAVSEGEKLPDARGIGAPIFGRSGVLGCVLLTSPKSRMPHENIEVIGRALVECAALLSRELGGTAGGQS